MAIDETTAPLNARAVRDSVEVYPNRWWTLIAVAIGAMMSGLDSSVSNAVLPVIRDALHTDASRVQWVGELDVADRVGRNRRHW